MKRARLEDVLLGITSTSLALCAAFAFLWVRAERREFSLADLSAEDRFSLAAQLLDISPGVYRPHVANPAVGYTMQPGQETEAWGDTFTPNDLGYRTRASKKAKGTFRVLFLGDSWTYGMGVKEEEAFPAQVEKLALARMPDGQIECWNMGMPGYNTFNEIAAGETYFETLRPDVVVLCPTVNDADSGHSVLNTGNLTRRLVSGPDDFGWPMPMTFHGQSYDAFVWNARWDQALGALKRFETWLSRHQVPLLLFFAGPWEPEIAHDFIHRSGLGSLYVVTPPEFSTKDWRNPRPIGHGTPKANKLYARFVYAELAELLGWPALAESSGRAPISVHRAGGDSDWSAAAHSVFRKLSQRIPTTYRPGTKSTGQTIWMLNTRSGLVNRDAAVAVRRGKRVSALKITLAALPRLSSLYPLKVKLWIPSPAGETSVETEIPRDANQHRVLLPMPDDIAPGEVIVVLMEADRVQADFKLRLGGSFRVVSIGPDR